MLGSEYNWLVSISQPADGAPQVRLARGGLVTLLVAVFCLLAVALRAEPPHVQLMRDARAAQQAGDNPLVIDKLEAAQALRPDYPRAAINLARAYTAAGRADDAIAQLRALAAMGLVLDVAADPALAPLRDRPDFTALAKALANNGASAVTTHDEAAWAVTDVTGILEAVAIHPTTLESFFSDVHQRCIWYRDASGPSGVLRKFSQDSDGLLGVFALKIDAATNTLWASSAALPEMKGYTETDLGRALLAEYDLTTRKLRRTYSLAPDGRAHVLGDMTPAPDGSLYLTDSGSPVIWRLPPGGPDLVKWLENEDFMSLQGVTVGRDGSSLYVADYANGIWRVDLATRATTLLAAPAHATLFGIDGLYAVPGALIAVQNGVNPQRVVRIALDAAGRPSAFKVLRAGHPAMTDAALGQVINGHFDFIANSGWSLFEDPKAAPAPRTVTILRTEVE